LLVCALSALVTALLWGRADAIALAVCLMVAVIASVWALATCPATGPLARVTPTDVLRPGEDVLVYLLPAALPPPPDGAVVDLTPWLPIPVATNATGQVFGYRFAAPARGAFTLGPSVVALNGPLGLSTSRHRTAPAAEVLVAPPLVALDFPLPNSYHERQQARTSPTLERVTDPSAVRPYQVGDPRRLVHWKATARRDRLMVRETINRRQVDSWVVVDDAAPPGPMTEMAIALVASAAEQLLDAGHTVWLARTSGRFGPSRFTPSANHQLLLAAFARIELDDDLDQARPFSQMILAATGSRLSGAPIYAALPTSASKTVDGFSALGDLADPGVLWLLDDARQLMDNPKLSNWERRIVE
jgi:uncharacterized protein (DUF58 family)